MMNSELNLEFCATCLKIGSEDDKFVKLNFTPPEEISFNDKLQFCVPEMVIEDIEDCLLCKPCLAALETSYTFKCMCLKTTKKLKEFRNAQSKNCDVANTDTTEEFIQNNNITEQTPENSNLNDKLIQTVDDMLSDSGISTNAIVTANHSNSECFNGIVSNQNKPHISIYESNNLEQLDLENHSADYSDYDLNPSPLSERCNKDDDSQIEIVKDELGCLLTESLEHVPCFIPSTNQVEIEINSIQDIMSFNSRSQANKSIVSKSLTTVVKTKNFKAKSNRKSVSLNKKSNLNCLEQNLIAREESLTTFAKTKNFKAKSNRKSVSSNKKSNLNCPEQNLIAREADANVEIIETACKRIPELHNCSPKSLQCQVILEKLVLSQLPVRSRLGLERTSCKEPFYYCIICHVDIQRKFRFISHFLRHLDIKPYKCNKCTAQFYNRDQLIKHHRTEHNVQDDFRKDKRLKHMNEIAEELVGDFLETKGYTFDDLIKKVTETNNLRLCLENSKKNKVVKKIKNTNSKVRRDSKVINKKSKVAKRNSLVSLSYKVHSCKLCRYHSYSKYKYDTHMRRHNGIKPFQCSKCFKRFFEKWHINNHKCEVHYKISAEIECVQAPVSKQESANKTEHKKSHTSMQPKNLIQLELSSSVKPVKKKKKKKKYYCEICNLEYSSKDHKYVHTGEKPYKCEICEKYFGAYTTRRKHRLTHLKKKEKMKNKKKKQAVKVTLQESSREEQFAKEDSLRGLPLLIEESPQPCDMSSHEEQFAKEDSLHGPPLLIEVSTTM